jgi:transposase-like protein
MGRRSKYPEEFRRNAAKLALDGGRSVRDVARELGVNHETLRNWVEQRRKERRDGPAIGAQHRIGQLEQRIRPRGQRRVELLPETAKITPAGRGVPARSARLVKGSRPTEK